MSLLSKLILNALFLASGISTITGAFGAELKVDPKDMPRVPATEPANALKTFQVREGFRLELAAAEPIVMSPIAMAFDESGRLFVVEMRDYSERRDEHLGRIRMLIDEDGDGRFDKSTVYADNLPWPTAVICYDGGIFVGATPDIFYFKDTNGDGVADLRKQVFTGFGSTVERLNVQQLFNSFNWGLDNRIHGASGGNGGKITTIDHPEAKPVDMRGHDFSFDPRTLDFRAESGGAQYGLSFDDRGREYVCSNSSHIQEVMYDEAYAGRNPYYGMPSPLEGIAEDGPAAEVYRISPDEPWRVIRTHWRVTGKVPGLIEGGGRPSGYFTGATGVTIYRGNAWPKEYRGDAFIADIGSNLIHHKRLYPNGVERIARRPNDELKREFIASTDNWFRPAQFANAPDGTLYVADMYREVIEHPWSLPEPIKVHLDLNSGNDRGRIYRIVPEGFRQPALPRLGEATSAELVHLLTHENGWHRDTAARLIFERQDQSVVPALTNLARNASTALGRMHALYALDGLRALTPALLSAAFHDNAPEVREHAIRLSSISIHGPKAELMLEMFPLADDPDIEVRYRLAYATAEMDRESKVKVLARLAAQDAEDGWMRTAILNSAGSDAEPLLSHFIQSKIAAKSQGEQELIIQLVRMAIRAGAEQTVGNIADQLGALSDPELTFRLARELSLAPGAKGASASAKLIPVYRRALQVSRDNQAALPLRAQATQVLGFTSWAEAGPVILDLLKPQRPSDLQLAAVQSLLRFKNSEARDALFEHFPGLAPHPRSEALNAMLSRASYAGQLLASIEKGILPRSELSSTQVKLLKSHNDKAVRELAEKLFPANAPGSRDALIRELRPALDLQGDAAKGKTIFMQRCFSCHRIDNDGYEVGPNLASVRANGKEKLLTNIIDPNREVPANYLSYAVETSNGQTFLGLLAAETETSITIRQAFRNDQTVLRGDIKSLRGLNQSLMPEGLEASLSPQDMADLLEFIVEGTPAHP